jgi:hypothetical protein
MLKDRADGMPAEYEPSTELLGKASRRRATKVVALGVAVFVVAAGAVGVLAREVTQKKVDVEHPGTSVPANTPAKRGTLPAVGCPGEAAVSENAHLAAPNISFATGVDVSPTAASALALYEANDFVTRRATTWSTVLAPRGYQCRIEESGDGEDTFIMSPTLPAGFSDPAVPYVKVFRDFLGHNPTIDQQCSYFPDASFKNQAKNENVPCVPPAGLHKIGEGAYAWGSASDQNVAVMQESQMKFPQGEWETLTCKLTASEASLCDAIIAEWVASNPGRAAAPETDVVTRDGLIGTVRLRGSTQSDVIAAVGTPDATGTGQMAANYPAFKALGYDCTTSPSDGRDPIVLQPTTHGPYCKTIYYINATTNTLGAFSTTSDAFATESGTSVGTPLVQAETNEGQNSSAGCDTGIHFGQSVRIFINVGTNPTDHVNRITAESSTNGVGVLFC